MKNIIQQNKIKRKKFFASLGASALGITLFNSFPINLFISKSELSNNQQVNVHINPLAVNRKKIGEKNASK